MSLTLDGTLGLNSINIGANIPGTGTFTTLNTIGNVTLGDASGDTITLNSGMVTLNNSTTISAASTKTLTLNGGAGSNGLVIDASNNVGIGTGTPGAKLDVTGNQIIRHNSYDACTILGSSSNSIALRIQNTYSGARNWNIGSSGGGPSPAGAFFIYDDSANATRLIIDTAGNLGLGVTPSYRLDVAADSGAIGLNIRGRSSDGISVIRMANNSNAEKFRLDVRNDNTVYFQQGGTTQAMTLDASGRLLVTATSAVANAHQINQITDNVYSCLFRTTTTTAGASYGIGVTYASQDPNGTGNEFIQCYGSSTQRFAVRSNGGVANFSGNNVNLSDERVKTEITPAPSWLPKINAIEVVNFKYKDQTHEDPNLGVIAQQVLSVAPELVDEDGFGETPEDGVPLMAIFETDLKYAMLKAIQELSQEIETLKQRIK